MPPIHFPSLMSANEKIRILVVDDHYVVRVGLVGILSLQPDCVVVAEAEDGEQAIRAFRECRPDVTLMDARMPGMNGVDAITKIRSDAPNARIIMLTTYDGDEDMIFVTRGR